MEIRSVTPDISVMLTDDNKLAIHIETGDRIAEITDIDLLASKLRELELIQAEREQMRIAREYGGRCTVPMIHQDKSESQCVLPKKHLLDDSDHVDEHGHHAPVLVHQSTIREVQRVQELRDRGEID